jgi:protein phosphatase
LNPKRAANEDRLLALPQARLFLVADGVGGRRGGQVASQTVVDVFQKAFSEQPRNSSDLLALLKQTINICNRSIFDSANEIADLQGMATTVALIAAVNDTRAIIGHVGDSRVYRFDGRELVCETEDHSEVNDAVRAGVLSTAQAAHHPRRNVINRAIGAEFEVEADFKIVPLNEHTSFLLCSDGVTRHITDAELAELVRGKPHPQKLCAQLKEICFERGAEDNLSAIIVDFGERNYLEPQTRPAIARLQASRAPVSRFQVDFSEPSGVFTEPEASEPKQSYASGRLTNPVAREPVTHGLPPKTPRLVESSASSITFWGAPNATAEKPKAPPAVPNSFAWRDVLMLAFYLILLAVAFGLGRNYDALLAWISGEPARVAGVAAETNSDNPELAAARALFEQRRFDKARDSFTLLAASKPDRAEYLYWLGRANLELKQYPDAIKQLQAAVQLDAKLPQIYLHLALAYSASGDKKNADEMLKKAAQ